MTIWQPDPGETLLSRAPVTFATGAAPRVRGMRWFRDTERNDIRHELPGWPEGPSFTARSTGGAVAERSLRGAATAAGVAVMAFLSAAGQLSGGGGGSDDSGSDTPDDPADEVEDFPVMWAAPGTIARTLPWQLDPGRADAKRHSTHLIVTDRRLVVVGLPFDKKDLKAIEDEVLWQCARTDVEGIEVKDFKDGNDFKVTFGDGSWCRLSCNWRMKLTSYLVPPRDLIPLESCPAKENRSGICRREADAGFRFSHPLPKSKRANSDRYPAPEQVHIRLRSLGSDRHHGTRWTQGRHRRLSARGLLTPSASSPLERPSVQ